MRFAKYHALGNDYLVIEAPESGAAPPAVLIRRICDRRFGVGSDGLLVRGSETPDGCFALRIFNPDGTEAEKSGNGLRIFARYLWDQGAVHGEPFCVDTVGGRVTCRVKDDGSQVTVDMGRVSFESDRIPVAGPPRDVLNETMEVHGQSLVFSAATIGNPHCVLLREAVSAAEAKALGPAIENDPRFPNRTNVQFVQVLDRRSIKMEIWERGAGYTLASGSSSCAAAAVLRRLDLVGPSVTVHMPGGSLEIEVSDAFDVRMTGPVAKIIDGRLSDEMIETVG